MTKFLGFKHMAGHSYRTGNDYDFYELSFCSDADANYTGFYVFTESVNPDFVSDESALADHINDEVIISYVKSGNRTLVNSLEFK